MCTCVYRLRNLITSIEDDRGALSSDASVRVLRQQSSHDILSPSSHQLDSYSLSSLQNIRPPVPNSLSVTWPSYHTPESTSPCNSLAQIQQPCSCPMVGRSLASTTTPVLGGGFHTGGRLLRHSNSAPAISVGHYRRHSLQPLYSLNSSSNQIMGHMHSCSRAQMRRSSYASSGWSMSVCECSKNLKLYPWQYLSIIAPPG